MLMFVTVFSAQFLGLMVVFGKVKGICLFIQHCI